MEANLKAVVVFANRLCRASGFQVDAIELAYLASLLEHQGSWASSGNDSSSSCSSSLAGGPLSAQEVQRLAQQLSERAMGQDPTDWATMQLQIAMESAYQQQQRQVEEELQQQADKVDTYLRAATRTLSGASSTADHEKAFCKVLDYVCAKGGLERALPGGDEGARQEVYAALESAFPMSGVARYCSQTRADKETQLDSLAHVTVGILLFNQGRASGGSALPAGAAIYLPQAQRLLRDVSRTAAELRRTFDTANTSKSSSSSSGGSNGSSSQPSTTVAPRVLYAAQALAAVGKMASDLQGGLGACEVLAHALEQGLVTAQGLVGASAAVSKEQVFPVFEQMGVVHAALGQELRLLVVRQRLFDTLEALLRGGSSSSTSKGVVAPLLSGDGRSGHGRSSVATSAAVAAGEPLDEAAVAGLPSDMEYVPPEASGGSSGGSSNGRSSNGRSSAGGSRNCTLPADIALAGLCPWSVAQRGDLGLQLGAMAQPSVGCLRYAGCIYGFSSTQALLTFAQQPREVLQSVAELAHAQPLLRHLLGLASQQQQEQQQEQGQVQHQEQQVQSQPEVLVQAQQQQQQEEEEQRQEEEQQQGEEQKQDQQQQQEGEQAEQQQDQQEKKDDHMNVTDSIDSQAVTDSINSTTGEEQQQQPGDEAPAEQASSAASDAAATSNGDSTPSRADNAADTTSAASTASTAVTAAANSINAAAAGAAAAAPAPAATAGASTKQPALPSLRALMDLMAAAPLKVEMGTQTPTHFVERHIDVNYEWNEWALRRRVIALANLRNKATHSAQTALSHFRRDGDTQTWAPKQATSQTPSSKGQAMPRKLRYVAGLRGSPGTKMKVVSLELELGQPHQF